MNDNGYTRAQSDAYWALAYQLHIQLYLKRIKFKKSRKSQYISLEIISKTKSVMRFYDVFSNLGTKAHLILST